MSDEFVPAVCPFCSYAVVAPDFEDILDCPGCGASYWVEGADDLADVRDDAADILAVDPSQVETRIIPNYDRWTADVDQPPEEGEEVCLVFVRAKLRA